MTREELQTFIAAVRVEIEAAIARLATVDLDDLPPDLRAMVTDSRRAWEQLRALTEDALIELHDVGCLEAERGLTIDGLLARLTRQ